MAEVRLLDKVAPFHYVYFVRANEIGLTKVGRSRNLGQRFHALTKRMGPLTLLCCIPTFDPNLESQIHHLLRTYRYDEFGKEREWFLIPEEQLFIVIKEIIRGFRNWSDPAPRRIFAGKSFLNFENHEIRHNESRVIAGRYGPRMHWGDTPKREGGE